MFPSAQTAWDYNSNTGKEKLEAYRQTLLGAIRGAAIWPTNISKITDVVQGGNESLSTFLERMLEAYCTFSPMDPMAPENQKAMIMIFISQAAADIRHELQNYRGSKERHYQS